MKDEKEIIIFNTSEINLPPEEISAELKIWRPSLFSFKPKGKPLKYSLYTGFHYFKLFKNSSYCHIGLIINKEQVASMLVIPAHFKYPFMKPNDVQFTYVMTTPRHRGKGYAWKLIYEASKNFGGGLWYVTNRNNTSSIKLANKMGFKNVYTGEKGGLFNIIRNK